MAEPSDHLLAARLATAAGALLVAARQELSDAGADGQTLKDEGDRRSHELLMQRLGGERPDDAVLSEEGADDRGRLTAERIWMTSQGLDGEQGGGS